MADKSWMLPANQLNKKRMYNRKSSMDFMAADTRTHEAELQKTYQNLDDAYRVFQRKQRREMAELRKFMRQVNTVIHVEMPGEKRDSLKPKRLTRKERYLEKIRLRQAKEEERRNALLEASRDARRPSFAQIGAIYAATSRSIRAMQPETSTDNQQGNSSTSNGLDEIAESDQELEYPGQDVLDRTLRNRPDDSIVSSISSTQDYSLVGNTFNDRRDQTRRRRRPVYTSTVPSVLPDIVDISAPESSHAIAGHSVRRSKRNRTPGKIIDGLQQNGKEHFLPAIEQTL